MGDWKISAKSEPENQSGPWKLYNLKIDRTEMHNLAKKYPEKMKELIAEWKRIVEGFRRDLKNSDLKMTKPSWVRMRILRESHQWRYSFVKNQQARLAGIFYTPSFPTHPPRANVFVADLCPAEPHKLEVILGSPTLLRSI